ncbi:hypothetical protein, partial [Piscinibacter sakaiensis]|uniref:hypothetical protein n=1 Tax=Piscinibacter sakaiensis TaxID=1547922 RepID=UPI001E5FD401
VDGAQDDFARGAGMSAPAGRQEALEQRQGGPKRAAQGLKSSAFDASRNLTCQGADQAISELVLQTFPRWQRQFPLYSHLFRIRRDDANKNPIRSD